MLVNELQGSDVCVGAHVHWFLIRVSVYVYAFFRVQNVEPSRGPLRELSTVDQENIPETNKLLKDMPSLEKAPSQNISKSTQLSVTQFLRKL